MCLNRTYPYRLKAWQNEKKAIRAYKVMRRHEWIHMGNKWWCGPCQSMHQYHVGLNKTEWGGELRDREGVSYRSGFHCWTDKDAAQEWSIGTEEKVVEVLIDPAKLVAVGTETRYSGQPCCVLVASEMFVPELPELGD